MSDQEEARIATSRHFDDLYSRWLVRPSPGNRFLNYRLGPTPVSAAREKVTISGSIRSWRSPNGRRCYSDL